MQFIDVINVKGEEYLLQATYDSLGNVIAETYAKFTEVESAIEEAVADLIDGAPEALNTLQEISASLKDNSDFAGTMTTELSKKANSEDVYTKTEIDAIKTGIDSSILANVNTLSGEILKKANSVDVYTKADTYTKTEVNAIAFTKANANDVYTKSDVYTKTEIDSTFALKSEIKDIPENVSDFTNDAGYLVSDDVADFAKSDDVNTALESKVDKKEGFELIASASAAKIAALPTVEQYNNKMDLIDLAIAAMGANVDNAITTNTTQQGLIDANTSAIDNKVDKIDDHSLVANSDIEKLKTIEEGANKYEHPEEEGWIHIPAGGEADNILIFASSGTAAWSDLLSLLIARVAELEAKVAALEAIHANPEEPEEGGEEQPVE